MSDIGIVIDNEIGKIEKIYQNIKVNKYVIMPNHIHLIIVIYADEKGGLPEGAPTVGKIINKFKGSVSKQAGFPVWQKSFHDHIIRNERQYRLIWDYIDTNPLKWEDDCYYSI